MAQAIANIFKNHFSALVFALFLYTLPLSAQTHFSSAPILEFKLPMFSEKGYKIWDLYGSEGHYLSENELEVFDIRLKTFSNNSNNTLEATFESHKAILALKMNQVSSNEKITIKNPKYTITGIGWFWEGTSKKLTINTQVKATFQSSLK